MSDLTCVCYVSDAVRAMAPLELKGLLARARKNNAADGTTGLLLYSAGHFMQVMEGRAELVQSRFDRIRVDHRHRNLRLVLQEPIDARLFAQWQMGWLDLGDVATFDTARIGDMVTANRANVVSLLREFRNQLPDHRDDAAAQPATQQAAQ
jgi:hypothetical protein